MKALWNGLPIDIDQPAVALTDRGFLYGDGVFDTILAFRGRLFRLDQHLDRFLGGCEKLGLTGLPPRQNLERQLTNFPEWVQADQNTGLLRLQATRGPGPRGLATSGSGPANWCATWHARPDLPPVETPAWDLMLSSIPLTPHPLLTGIKTTNRLPWILARREAEQSGVHDALMVDPAGHPIEATAANIFWMEEGQWRTPPISSGALPGVTRGLVLDLAQADGAPVREEVPTANRLHRAEAVFLTQTSLGVIEGRSLDHQPLAGHPETRRWFQRLWATVRDECAPPPPPRALA